MLIRGIVEHRCLVSSLICTSIFILTLPSMQHISSTLSLYIPKSVNNVRHELSGLKISNEYGVFLENTGKRYEIIIEGTADNIQWKEYDFNYKPGILEAPPSQAAPYYSCLDSQMCLIAQSPPETEEWYITFLYRLLSESNDVKFLLKTDPFKNSTVQAIRANLYEYSFSSHNASNWWERSFIRRYHLPISVNDSIFDDIKTKDHHDKKLIDHNLSDWLKVLRSTIEHLTGFQFCTGMALVALLTGQLQDVGIDSAEKMLELIWQRYLKKFKFAYHINDPNVLL
ncbi:hypothetical protein GJ496_002727 [Pomphorhynchus laevis]|nr:hypothetical protein GJ496_002727 [Pomphorhynchus laevis]